MSLELLPDAVMFKIIDLVRCRTVKKINKHFAATVKAYLQDEYRSVMRIQNFWRWYGPFMSTKALVVRFQAAKLTGNQIPDLGFDAAVVHLSETKTIAHASQFFKRILTVSQQTSENHDIMVFLVSYLVAHFPMQAFDQFHAPEQAVMHEGRMLLACVDRCVDNYVAHPREKLSALHAQLKVYERAYIAWKNPDIALLIARIEHTLLHLSYAARHIQHDDPLQIGIHVQRLRAKLFEIDGLAGLERFDNTLMDMQTLGIYSALSFGWDVRVNDYEDMYLEWDMRANDFMNGV